MPALRAAALAAIAAGPNEQLYGFVEIY